MKEGLRESFDRAAKLVDVGDLAAAKSILVDLADCDSNSPAIFAVLGNVCWKLGELDEAVVSFRRAVELRPALEAASLGLFHSLWESGRQEEAVEEIKRFQSISDSEDYRRIVRQINEEVE